MEFITEISPHFDHETACRILTLLESEVDCEETL